MRHYSIDVSVIPQTNHVPTFLICLQNQQNLKFNCFSYLSFAFVGTALSLFFFAEIIKTLSRMYIPLVFIKHIISAGKQQKRGGKHKYATIRYRNSTRWLLNVYFTQCIRMSRWCSQKKLGLSIRLSADQVPAVSN